jgi:hypothetical protein
MATTTSATKLKREIAELKAHIASLEARLMNRYEALKAANRVNHQFKEQNDWLRATLDDYQKAFRSGPKVNTADIDV